MKLQFFLFVAHTMCTGIHAPVVAGLRVPAFGKGWEAFFASLVGVVTQPVAYEYAGVTALDPTHQVH